MASKSGTTLSVVLPVKNAQPYIGTALTSLARNARSDYEFVVIDDGSDDGTTEIIDSYRPRLPMINVIRHDRSSTGAGSGRTRAPRPGGAGPSTWADRDPTAP